MSMYINWIKYAKMGTLTTWLEQYDDKYVVSDLDISNNTSKFRREFDSFAKADSFFNSRCRGLHVVYRDSTAVEVFHAKNELHQTP